MRVKIDILSVFEWPGWAKPSYRFNNLFGGGKMPKVEAAQLSTTAIPINQLSETEKKNKALAASALTQNWNKDALKLGKQGLLGM